MVLTDDNFATIVNAVAYIATFLGAGILGIAGGVPLSPLQILWLNMVVDIPIAVALGFDEPTGGLMRRVPRPVGAPCCRREAGFGSVCRGS